MERYIECPAEVSAGLKSHCLTVFLGGGISGCPDWQQPAAQDILRHRDVAVLNPRRATFDITDPSATDFQIHWEHRYLAYADVILFWFPCETLCPITLFEYGKWLMSSKPLVVGTHPDYARRLDIEIQTRLERPHQTVHSNLGDMLDDLAARLKWM